MLKCCNVVCRNHDVNIPVSKASKYAEGGTTYNESTVWGNQTLAHLHWPSGLLGSP